jgi:hypothetical protein
MDNMDINDKRKCKWFIDLNLNGVNKINTCRIMLLLQIILAYIGLFLIR